MSRGAHVYYMHVCAWLHGARQTRGLKLDGCAGLVNQTPESLCWRASNCLWQEVVLWLLLMDSSLDFLLFTVNYRVIALKLCDCINNEIFDCHWLWWEHSVESIGWLFIKLKGAVRNFCLPHLAVSNYTNSKDALVANACIPLQLLEHITAKRTSPRTVS